MGRIISKPAFFFCLCVFCNEEIEICETYYRCRVLRVFVSFLKHKIVILKEDLSNTGHFFSFLTATNGSCEGSSQV